MSDYKRNRSRNTGNNLTFSSDNDENPVRAPYNFVPFSNRVIVRYEDDLPPHDKICADLNTGEIHLTFTAETPIFISNGEKDKSKVDFFRGANGKYMIPGSTVRGMTRENMQILGFGHVAKGEDIEEEYLYYREMATARKNVSKGLDEKYKKILDSKPYKTPSGKSYTIPENVKSGYLHHREDGSCCIYPTKETFARISRKNPAIKNYKEMTCKNIDISYKASGNEISVIYFSGKTDRAGMKKGTLLFTGKHVANPNAVYLFPEADYSVEPVEITKEDVQSYKNDWELRKNTLKGQDREGKFWDLPDKGTTTPVFYILDNGHTYFGKSLFLRIGHKFPVTDGLPKEHIRLSKEMDVVLDYPHTVLGYAKDNSMYKSRVSFEDFEVCDNAKSGNGVETVLGQPRPSYYAGYVKNEKNYSDDDFLLRGYKMYWLKDGGCVAADPKQSKVATKLMPMPKGTQFKGVVRFKNLTDDELGLLLWALKLDDNCYQTIGMAKPYGFGRTKVTIDKLMLVDSAALYGLDLNAGKIEKSATDIDEFIEAYKKYAIDYFNNKDDNKEEKTKKKGKKNKNKNDIYEFTEIADLIYIKSTIRDVSEVSYMSLKEYGDRSTVLKQISEVRREDKSKADKQSVEEMSAEDDINAMLAKYADMTNKNRTAR